MFKALVDQCVRKFPELCVIISVTIELNYTSNIKMLFHSAIIAWTIGWLIGILILNQLKMVK